jgi:hypothetical protein
LTLVAGLILFAACLVIFKWLRDTWHGLASENLSAKIRVLHTCVHAAVALVGVLLAAVFSFAFTVTVYNFGLGGIFV